MTQSYIVINSAGEVSPLLERNPDFAEAYALELSKLIQSADELRAARIEKCRWRWQTLLRSLPWDWQSGQRKAELVLHCEELLGDEGEKVAYSIMAGR